jgi:hypothetical protein
MLRLISSAPAEVGTTSNKNEDESEGECTIFSRRAFRLFLSKFFSSNSRDLVHVLSGITADLLGLLSCSFSIDSCLFGLLMRLLFRPERYPQFCDSFGLIGRHFLATRL